MSYEECPACGSGHREDCPVCGGPPSENAAALSAIAARLQEEHDRVVGVPQAVDQKLAAATEALKSEDILGDIGLRVLGGLQDRLVLCAALDRWGLPSQLAMLAEESAELAAATMHLLREKHEGPNEAEWCDEVADVWIMIDQMLLTKYAPQIEAARRRKMARLARRLEEAAGD